MKFVIREMDWFKRRTPKPEPKPVSVIVDDFQKVSNHPCSMIAKYDDGNEYELSARCHHNEIKDTWTVHGLDQHGHSVLCDVEEE